MLKDHRPLSDGAARPAKILDVLLDEREVVFEFRPPRGMAEAG